MKGLTDWPGRPGYISPHARQVLSRICGRARTRFALEAMRSGDAALPDAYPRARLFRSLTEAADTRKWSAELCRAHISRARSIRQALKDQQP